jgi:hypothetical protein
MGCWLCPARVVRFPACSYNRLNVVNNMCVVEKVKEVEISFALR